MKKIFIILLLLTSCASGGTTFKNEPDGFRGLLWGMNVKDARDLNYVNTDPRYGGIKMYTRAGDAMTIGSAKIEKIVYQFWRDRLCSVTIAVHGLDNWSGLQSATFDQFGPGSQTGLEPESYSWTGAKTSIMIQYDEGRQTGELWIGSKALAKEMQLYEKNKASHGASNGF